MPRRGPRRTRRPMVWITINFPEADKWLYDAIKIAAKAQRQPVSQYMRALAEVELTPVAEATDD